MSISISNRIILGFTAILGLTIAIGVFALGQIEEVRNTSSTVVQRDIAILREIGKVLSSERQVGDVRHRALLQLMAGSAVAPSGVAPATRADWEARIDQAQADLKAAIDMTRALVDVSLTAERREAWRAVGEALGGAAQELAKMRSGGEAQFAAIQAGDMARALSADAEIGAARTRLTERVTAAEAALTRSIAVGQQRIAAVYETTRSSILIAILATAVAGFLIAFAIRRSIVGPLGGFMNFVERVGTGDLAGAPAAMGGDEIGRLGTNLNAMVEGLRQLAAQSRDATENLNAAVAEIRASTQEQAAGVEEQLAAVQETAATVDEITHAGSQIGKRAQEVIVAAQATAHTSNQGLQAVEDTVLAMDSIREQAEAVAETILSLSEKTQAVGEIISTVNDISERSHLLALNAAIEAAAAGESGRSFAVVAAEMKLLADQAKEATVQVRSILGDIQRGINASVMLTEEAVKRVASGRQRTDTTQRTIEEITGRVQESVQTFQQIVASTNQQQLGIEQVMGALANIRQASQQTAAGTRQLDQAAGNLAQMAQTLTGLAARYRV